MKKYISIMLSCILCAALLSACDGIKVIQKYLYNSGFGGGKVEETWVPEITPAITEPETDNTETGTIITDPGQTTVVEINRTTAEEIPYNAPLTTPATISGKDKKKADKKNPVVGELYYLGNLETEKVQFDLDCNGKTNTISAEFTDYGGIESVKVSKSELSQYLEYIDPSAYAMSLDGKTYCLVLFDYGASDDYASYFYRFDGENLIYVGCIPYFYSAIEVENNNPETLKFWGSRRFDLIQTEFCMTAYRPVIGNDGYVMSIEQVEQKYYNYSYRIGEDSYGYYDRYYPLTITEDIQVYSKPDYYSETYLLHSGKAQFTYTDAEDWIFVECEDGSNGWLCASEYLNYYGYSDSVIEGLCFAD